MRALEDANSSFEISGHAGPTRAADTLGTEISQRNEPKLWQSAFKALTKAGTVIREAGRQLQVEHYHKTAKNPSPRLTVKSVPSA